MAVCIFRCAWRVRVRVPWLADSRAEASRCWARPCIDRCCRRQRCVDGVWSVGRSVCSALLCSALLSIDRSICDARPASIQVDLCGRLVSMESELERRGIFNALARAALGSTRDTTIKEEEEVQQGSASASASAFPEPHLLESVRPARLFDVLNYLDEEALDEAQTIQSTTMASRARLVQHLRRLRVEYRGELERAIGTHSSRRRRGERSTHEEGTPRTSTST